VVQNAIYYRFWCWLDLGPMYRQWRRQSAANGRAWTGH